MHGQDGPTNKRYNTALTRALFPARSTATHVSEQKNRQLENILPQHLLIKLLMHNMDN